MALGLIGYRGSGKSTVGAMVARRLHRRFVDTDQWIMQRAGKTIREIFQQDGETAFRDAESAVVGEACELQDAVIAFGGGAMDRPHNREALAAAGVRLIYLRCDAEELLARILADSKSAAQRPNLTALGGAAEVSAILARREPVWRAIMAAEIDVTGQSAEQVAAAVVQWNSGEDATQVETDASR